MSDVSEWILKNNFHTRDEMNCRMCRNLMTDKNENYYCLEMLLCNINRMEARVSWPDRCLCSRFDGRDSVSVEIPF
jgi:hypothetical protein